MPCDEFCTYSKQQLEKMGYVMPENKPRLHLLGDFRNFTLPEVFRNEDSPTCDMKK
jgi:hypothetical protein